MSPDSWQVEVLAAEEQQIALLCSRQSGKSTVAALKSLWTAVTVPGSLVLLVAPSQQQAGELVRKVIDFHSVDDGLPGLHLMSSLRIELENGSRIMIVPATERAVRGYSPDLLIVDEAARIESSVYRAMRPALLAKRAQGTGKLMVLSTPKGRRGWFYDIFHKEEGLWYTKEVPASSLPRIPQEFLEMEKRILGEAWYSQEYECSFVDGEFSFFSSLTIEMAQRTDLIPLFETPYMKGLEI